MPRVAAILLAALTAALLAGCGSGSGATTASETTFSLNDPAYQQALQARANETTTSVTATTPAPAATTTAAAPRARSPRPRIAQDPIPFGAQRRREMAAYAERHYGRATYRLTNPKVIVEHYTETPDFSSTFNTFAPDTPDPELHELPNVCAHFVVDTDGAIHQLVPLGVMCRHTVGLNWTAIGIEQVGSSDREILGRPAQMRSVLALTAWLQCRYGIRTRNVIGHNESLTSPYHREGVAALRTQTHDDWQKADMDVVRAKLRTYPCG